MSEQATTGRPWHLWVLAIFTLLWNGMACLDFYMTQTGNQAYFEDFGFTQEQMEFFTSFPAWAVAIWGIAVLSPMIGALCLLLQRRAAVQAFLIGLVTYALAMIRQYGFTDFNSLFPETHYKVMSVVIFVIALGQLLYARAMTSRGTLA